MAKETIVRLLDDLDGTLIDEGGATIHFSLEGRAYEIDLSEPNAEKLRADFAQYVSAGRLVGKMPRAAGATRNVGRRRGSDERTAIREWARNNGFTVGDRGRLPEEIVNAYSDAH